MGKDSNKGYSEKEAMARFEAGLKRIEHAAQAAEGKAEGEDGR